MEVILLKDVENLGYSDDIVSVKPGFARNFLLPQGIAVTANSANKDKLEERLAVKRADEDKLAAQVKEVVDALAKAKISIGGKTGTSGKLFGSITNLQLASAIKEATGFEIDRRKIEITEDVKELGSYKANVSLPQENNVEITFDVVAE